MSVFSFPFTVTPAAVAVAAATTSALYLLLGNLWHRVLSPLPAPDPSTYPQAGDSFGSVTEGVHQVVHRVEQGWVYGTAVLEPGAAGPPLHTHDHFTETFVVHEGTLAMQLADRVVYLGPGERITVAAGVPHRPFNPTDRRVVASGGDGPTFPQSFAASLVQLYHFMDTRGTSPLPMLLQLSVLDPIADTHLATMPRLLESVMRVVLAPAARLLGYRNYYPEWALHRRA